MGQECVDDPVRTVELAILEEVEFADLFDESGLFEDLSKSTCLGFFIEQYLAARSISFVLGRRVLWDS